MPTWDWSSVAASQRVRTVPKAAARRGCADGPGAGETHEQRVVRVGGEDRGDLGLEGVDGREHGPQLGGVALDREAERVDDRGVGGERLRGGHLASRVSITAARRQLCC